MLLLSLGDEGLEEGHGVGLDLGGEHILGRHQTLEDPLDVGTFQGQGLEKLQEMGGTHPDK